MTDLFTEEELIPVGCHAIYPPLEGVVNIGHGYDELSAREDYLSNLRELITALKETEAAIMYDVVALDYWSAQQ